ncbi:MAG: hypothetical protein JNK82_41655 [Myxococcaceae bacterium]|nr:hypothetical protein [Myxococcaceae bacterium]
MKKSLRSALADGSSGVSLTFPEKWPALADTAGRLVLSADDRACVVEAVALPWRLVLEPLDLYRAGVERSTRSAFEQVWASKPQKDDQPMTRQPGFSALSSFEKTPLGVQLVSREEYAAASELVTARVLMPVAAGTVELSVTARDPSTGARESIVYLASNKQRGPDFMTKVDDPALDAKFPAHCLSRARATLAALTGALKVTAPAAPTPAKEHLELLGVTVTAPPRFGRMPAGVMPSPGGHTTFTRVFHTLLADPQLFEVIGQALDGPLEARVRAFYASWEKQGVTTEKLEVSPAPKAGGGDEVLKVTFAGKHGGGAALSHARWLKRGKGVVAVTLSRPVWQTAAEVDAELDAAVASMTWGG